MKTVCCANMPYVAEAFETLGETVVKDGRALVAADVRDADLLAIRSTTRANRALLDGSRVRFVGTATIGTDHLDIPWLEEQGICWRYAPGCNANSVSEYVTVALLCLANRDGLTLRGKTIGIVGVGNVGGRVVDKARALGLRVLANDPPRQRAGEAGHASLTEPGETVPFVGLDAIRREADIVTFHVPLIREGPDRTVHLADAAFFAGLKPGAILVNSARGPVVDSEALLAALDSGLVRHCVLDTWEGEPAYRRDVLARAAMATPHIAGHSFEGKVMGTAMVYREACRFLGREPDWTPDALLPAPTVPRVELDVDGRSDEQALWELTRAVYDIEADDRALRATAAPGFAPPAETPPDKPAHAAGFDCLRKNYPIRREFRFTQAVLRHAGPALRETVRRLGFAMADQDGAEP